VGFPSRALVDAMLPATGWGSPASSSSSPRRWGCIPWPSSTTRAEVASPKIASWRIPRGAYEERLRAEDPHELRTLVGAIERRTPGYADGGSSSWTSIRAGVALICAAFHPRPVLVRLSDLKSNEYRDLLGGRLFEPTEENPMIAWRGASRYVDPLFLPAFEMECDALRAVRQRLGAGQPPAHGPVLPHPGGGPGGGPAPGPTGPFPQAGVPLFLMVELPSNVLEADRFHRRDGAVRRLHRLQRPGPDRVRRLPGRPGALRASRRPLSRGEVHDPHRRRAFRTRGLEIGICGQAPSDHPDEVPAFLVECGITSISVTPDTVVRVRMAVGEAERALYRQGDPETTVGARPLPLHPPPEPT
jgi:pyruvate, water dikinase